MFKDIFSWVIQLITQPGNTWKKLAEKEETNEQFLSRFIYPLIGLVTIAAFLGALKMEGNLEKALMVTIIAMVSAFGGFFLSAYLLNEFWDSLFSHKKDFKKWQRFVGYSSVLIFILHILLSLLLIVLPEFFFLQFFLLYTFYIVWEGAIPFMGVEEKERLKFASVTTIIILIMPMVIEKLMLFLMPNLRV